MKYLLSFLMFFSCHAGASKLPPPSGDILLTVTGNIEHHNQGNAVVFDIEMLEQLETVSFTTNTPWTDEPTKFTGVLIKDLLAYVGAASSNFKATARDKYWNELTDMDFESIPVIIAYKRNDKYMRLRDLGPLWIMFPFDDHPELNTEKYKTASVWQLIEIDVR